MHTCAHIYHSVRPATRRSYAWGWRACGRAAGAMRREHGVGTRGNTVFASSVSPLEYPVARTTQSIGVLSMHTGLACASACHTCPVQRAYGHAEVGTARWGLELCGAIALEGLCLRCGRSQRAGARRLGERAKQHTPCRRHLGRKDPEPPKGISAQHVVFAVVLYFIVRPGGAAHAGFGTPVGTSRSARQARQQRHGNAGKRRRTGVPALTADKALHAELQHRAL